MGTLDLQCGKSTVCSNCEGFAFSFEADKKVSKKRVRKLWKTITDEPFPSKLHAFVLINDEYEKTMRTLGECQLIKVQDLFEYGEKAEPKRSEAVVFRTNTSEYWILIKKKSRFSLRQNLRHELEHIANEVRLYEDPVFNDLTRQEN